MQNAIILNDDTKSLLRNISWFVVLPAVSIFHAYIFFQNMNHTGVLTFLGYQKQLTTATIGLYCFLYGVLIAVATLSYFTIKMKWEADFWKSEFNSMENRKKDFEKKFDTLKAASKQILVPYNLDMLVDKNLMDFVNVNNNPGVLHANAAKK